MGLKFYLLIQRYAILILRYAALRRIMVPPYAAQRRIMVQRYAL
jgi:hypothetical protein